MAYVAALSVGHVAVLDTLRGIMNKYKKKYCFPSQDTILERLEKIHGIKISKRTLNYWLDYLCRKGLIYRVRRLTRVRFMSTAYYICERAAGPAVKRVKSLIGSSKRLRKIFPSRMQSVANNKHKANCLHVSGVKQPLSQELKRSEEYLSETNRDEGGEKPVRAGWVAFGKYLEADKRRRLLKKE